MRGSQPPIKVPTIRRVIREQIVQAGGKEGTVSFGEHLLSKMTGRRGADRDWVRGTLDWFVREGLALEAQPLSAEGERVLTLTRTGRYVVESIYEGDGPRVFACDIKAIERNLRAAAREAIETTEVQRVLASGPWMRGAVYGPVVIGLEVSGWQSLDVGSRSQLLSQVQSYLFMPEGCSEGYVMVFNGSDGVPERLANGIGVQSRNKGQLGVIDGFVRIDRSVEIIDRDESRYRAMLMRELEDFGLRMDQEAREAGFDWVRRLGRGLSVSKSIHFEVKAMLGREAWTTTHDPV